MCVAAMTEAKAPRAIVNGTSSGTSSSWPHPWKIREPTALAATPLAVAFVWVEAVPIDVDVHLRLQR